MLATSGHLIIPAGASGDESAFRCVVRNSLTGEEILSAAHSLKPPKKGKFGCLSKVSRCKMLIHFKSAGPPRNDTVHFEARWRKMTKTLWLAIYTLAHLEKKIQVSIFDNVNPIFWGEWDINSKMIDADYLAGTTGSIWHKGDGVGVPPSRNLNWPPL